MKLLFLSPCRAFAFLAFALSALGLSATSARAGYFNYLIAYDDAWSVHAQAYNAVYSVSAPAQTQYDAASIVENIGTDLVNYINSGDTNTYYGYYSYTYAWASFRIENWGSGDYRMFLTLNGWN